MELKDIYIIMNPPYLDAGANIISKIRTTVDYKEFVTYLPLEHYQLSNTDLFSYQSNITPVNVDYTYDVGCQLHCARIHKEKCTDQLPDEFEISTYGDKSLSKYFSEQLIKHNYATDRDTKFDCFKINFKLTCILSRKEFLGDHEKLQISKVYQWNTVHPFPSTKIDTLNKRWGDPDIAFITFNSGSEKQNFIDFIYSDIGFKFMKKVFKAIGNNIYYRIELLLPKVDWKHSWTLPNILKEYNYTEAEIEKLILEL
jgi:hypothetical protein